MLDEIKGLGQGKFNSTSDLLHAQRKALLSYAYENVQKMKRLGECEESRQLRQRTKLAVNLVSFITLKTKVKRVKK